MKVLNIENYKDFNGYRYIRVLLFKYTLAIWRQDELTGSFIRTK